MQFSEQDIRSEIENDPAQLGYAGKTAAQITALMKGKTRQRPIPSIDVKRYLMIIDRWAEIVRVSRFGDNDNAKVRAAIRIVEALDGLPEFDLRVPQYAQAINVGLTQLVAQDLLTNQEKDTCLALAANRASRFEELGWLSIEVVDVERALAGGGQ